jgi:hypothetical protein
MNISKYLVILTFLSIALLSSLSFALADGIKGASLTVYNTGQALVKETRSVNLPKGLAGVVFKDVPVTMDPTSVHAIAKDMTVQDVQYSYLPISSTNILKRYVGKELTLILPDPVDANGRVQQKATLLAVTEQPVFEVGNEIYVGKVDGILFPELPKDLQQEPSLTLTTSSETEGKRDVLLSYLMGGITWRADYTLALNKGGDSGSLGAWATIKNTSGRGFVGTSLKLVAGEVNRARSARNMYAKSAGMEMDMAMEAVPAPQNQESFSQFHVYSVERPVSLSESGTRQISLFSSPKVMVKEELVSTFHGSGGQQRGEIKQGVALNLLLDNTKNNGLGRPMPGGLVRVFRPTSDGSQLLAGETHISHSGNGSKVKLPLGRAFDMSVKRTQTSFKRIGKNGFELGWEVSVINGSKKTQSLTLRDIYSGDWEVIQSDTKHTVPDSASLEFALNVPPNASGQPLLVKYTVRITY